MRDPRGRISATDDRMVRELVDELPAGDFLRQPLARELVRAGLLVDYELPDPTHVVAPRIPFVSQPSEWSRLQLLDAALLTLDLAERALSAGFELKDASAWNVIYDGCEPVFCDHLSFEAITRAQWRALGQFARHFILPLLVAKTRGLPVHVQFRSYRDGIPPEVARRLCGWRMWFSRALPLVLAAHGREQRSPGDSPGEGRRGQQGMHSNLLRYCRFALPSRTRTQSSSHAGSVEWSRYERERHHYSPESLEHKAQRVREWIGRTRPSWVLDLGANTGEFSLLAASGGARVVAVDADHDCMEQLYRRVRGEPKLARAVYPVIAQLDDLCAGRGWCGREAQGLLTRLDGLCDVVMMLGLVHHLMIGGAIRSADVAEFAARVARRTLILEVVPEQDPMFQKLAAQYGRTRDAASACGREAQMSAFLRHFDILDQSPLPGTHRTLLLLAKKAG